MATSPSEEEDQEQVSAQAGASELPRLRWTQILAISIFAFAFNFHWAALGTIILPSQVLRMVGDLNKGTALAEVLVPGAFVSLFANPLFGWLSDRTRGRLARWGRRRPYLLVGTLVNVVGLIWMAHAQSVVELSLAYMLVQFSSNAAQAPFHALLPDMVPASQRGLTSGVIGLLVIGGNIGGVILAGLVVNDALPLVQYQHGLAIAYGFIILVMLVLMLITLFSVHERAFSATQDASSTQGRAQGCAASRLVRSVLWTLVGTALIVLLAWGLMTFWNVQHMAGLQIDGSVQQVVLELLATIGILRLFDFHPRRDPDFAWVLATRLIMMLGIYTIQTFLEYYMRDAVGVANPEQATTLFLIIVSLTSLVTAFLAGWLSDRFGRKRLVYIAGALMALVGTIFVITHSFVIVMAAGALFGLGYGAYQSVDWALVVDVLPSQETFARDMGVWNVAASLPQVIAPVLGGPLLDAFTRAGRPVLGYQLLFTMALVYCILGTITVRFIRTVKR